MLTTASILASSVLAVKKSSSSTVTTVHNTPSKSTTAHHVKGVNVLPVNYGALTATSKSSMSDSISRVYSFNILPTGSQPTSLQHSPRYTPSSQPGALKLAR